MLTSPHFTFARHYVEMVVAMFLGMLLLGGALLGVLELAGVDSGSRHDEAIELSLLAMATTMSIPMVAWMRHRGHAWRPCWEMTASMFVPSVAAIALLWAGVTEDSETLMLIQHVGMFPAMLAVMLLRRDEYSGHAAHA
jgi:hypothetical protein